MIWCTWINKPWILIVGDGCIGSTSHSSKLCGKIFALISKIHPVIAIQSLMSRLPTNLTWWSFMLKTLRGILRSEILRGKILRRELLLTSTMVEPASTSSSSCIVPSSSSTWTMILWLMWWTIIRFSIGSKHSKSVRDWIKVISHSLFLTLQHNSKSLISDRITPSMNCRTEMCKFSRKSFEHYANQLFIINYHSHNKEFVTSNFNLLQKWIHRFINFLDTLQFKLEIQDVISWCGSEPLF